MANDTQARSHPPEPERPSGQDGAPLDPRRWWALTIILIAGFMDLLDATIVNVAVPSIQQDLGAKYADIEWTIAAYALAFAAVLITGGRLGDIYGRKRVFLLGMAGFTVASALCGLSVNPEMLIASRFLQGMTAALMVPQILAIIHVTFPPAERGKVFGLFGGIVGSAAVAGPIVGGLLVNWDLWDLGWRPIFLVNVPVGIATLIAGWLLIRESHSPTAPKLDLVGMVLAVAAILALVYPLTEGRRLDWPLWTYLMMASSVPLLVAFVWYERWRTGKVGSPLVVLSLFRARTFASGLGVWLLFNIALGGFFLVWTLYMQIGLGWTALHAGLTAVFFALGAAPAAGASVQVLTPRFGRKVLMAGALLNAIGFGSYVWVATRYGTEVSSWQMIPPLLLSGIGFGLVVAPITDLVLSDVPVEDAGSASGLFSTTQQLGQALGVSLIGVLFFGLLASQADKGVDSVVPQLRAELSAAGVPEAAQGPLIDGFRTCVNDRSSAADPSEIPPSCEALNQGGGQPASPAVAAAFEKAGNEANGYDFARSFGITLWYGVGILVLVFLGMFLLPRRVRVLDPEEEPVLIR